MKWSKSYYSIVYTTKSQIKSNPTATWKCKNHVSCSSKSILTMDLQIIS